jgi:hypothetical protein
MFERKEGQIEDVLRWYVHFAIRHRSWRRQRAGTRRFIRKLMRISLEKEALGILVYWGWEIL